MKTVIINGNPDGADQANLDRYLKQLERFTYSICSARLLLNIIR